MNTTRKGGPDSTKPAAISPDDERLLAFQPGPLTDETRAAIAAHRARFVKLREQRRTDPPPADAGKTVRDLVTGAVIIRPLHDARFSDDACSGMMPLPGESE